MVGGGDERGEGEWFSILIRLSICPAKLHCKMEISIKSRRGKGNTPGDFYFLKKGHKS